MSFFNESAGNCLTYSLTKHNISTYILMQKGQCGFIDCYIMLCVLGRLVALTELYYPWLFLFTCKMSSRDGVFKKIMFRFPVFNGEIEIAPSVTLYIL